MKELPKGSSLLETFQEHKDYICTALVEAWTSSLSGTGIQQCVFSCRLKRSNNHSISLLQLQSGYLGKG